MGRLIVSILLVGLIFVPYADGSSPATLALRALKIAKRADTKATQALNVTRAAGPQGTRGEQGASGPAGQNGSNGSNGAPGPKGDMGSDGQANLNVASAENEGAVRLGTLANTTAATTVATVNLSRPSPGQLLAQATVQLAETTGIPDTDVRCHLALDGSTLTERGTDIAGHGTSSLFLASTPTADAGVHVVSLVCGRSNGATDSLETVPAHGATLVVLGG